jgi:hypothetical protein
MLLGVAPGGSREFRDMLARVVDDIETALTTNSDQTNYRPHNLHNGRRLREPEL